MRLFQGKKHFRAFLCILTAAAFIMSGCSNNSPGSEISRSSDYSGEEAYAEDSSNSFENETEESASSYSSSEEVQSASRDIFAMDTYMTITCYGKECESALDEAVAEIYRLDDLLSVGNENSEISNINRNSGGQTDEVAAVMIEKSLELYEKTGGSFDITVYPLMELWGFVSQEYYLPSDNEIKETLEKIGSDRMRLDRNTGTVSLDKDQGIDLGGIAKGYMSDRLMKIFNDHDLISAVVSLGGNVQCYRRKPDGSLWRCGIRDPFAPDDINSFAGIVEIENKAVITSGAYERFFTGEDGTVYHHILDPHTGYPADSGLCSVTIVSESGILADALSTACYVMGLEKSAEYWRESDKDFDFILVTDDGEVYITEPLESCFTTDYKLHIIKEDGIS